MIKRSMLQKDAATFNVCMSNNRALRQLRQKLIELQGEIDESTIIAGDFITPLSVINRSSRQKICEDIVELYSTISQLDLIDIYRILNPTTAEYTFFSKKIDIFQCKK